MYGLYPYPKGEYMHINGLLLGIITKRVPAGVMAMPGVNEGVAGVLPKFRKRSE